MRLVVEPVENGFVITAYHPNDVWRSVKWVCNTRAEVGLKIHAILDNGLLVFGESSAS